MKILTITEAAKILGVSGWTVRRHILTGRIAVIDVSSSGALRKRFRIPQPALDAFLASAAHLGGPR